MTFQRWFSIMVVLRLWTHFQMKYALDFAFIAVEKAPMYQFPIHEDIPVSLVPSVDKNIGLPVENVYMLAHSYTLPIEPVAQNTWAVDVYLMYVGIGHLSQVVLYTEPIKVETTFVYVDMNDEENITRYMHDFDFFNDGKWQWETHGQ